MANQVLPDLLWKAAIEDFFDAFLSYFFPESIAGINFDRPFEFLDQELAQLMPNHAEGSRRVDKLAKVWLKNGQEQWFLVHVEAQGYNDDTFARRMFTTYYRILDKYDREITAVVIYTNSSRRKQPGGYHRKWMGTTVQYQFNTISLSKTKDVASLGREQNPFGIVLQAAWGMTRKRTLNELTLNELRLGILRKLAQAGMSRQRIERLIFFLSEFVHLTDPTLNRIFEAEVDHFIPKPQPSMGIIEVVQEHYKQVGLQEGLQEGLQQGLEQGIEQATKQAEQAMLEKDRALVTRMVQAGLTDDAIVAYSGLSPEFVQQVRRELE